MEELKIDTKSVEGWQRDSAQADGLRVSRESCYYIFRAEISGGIMFRDPVTYQMTPTQIRLDGSEGQPWEIQYFLRSADRALHRQNPGVRLADGAQMSLLPSQSQLWERDRGTMGFR